MTRTNMNRLPIRVYLRYVQQFGIYASGELVRDGFHPRTVLSKAEKSSRKRYTEYGVSPWYSWMTETGENFLGNEKREETE